MLLEVFLFLSVTNYINTTTKTIVCVSLLNCSIGLRYGVGELDVPLPSFLKSALIKLRDKNDKGNGNFDITEENDEQSNE